MTDQLTPPPPPPPVPEPPDRPRRGRPARRSRRPASPSREGSRQKTAAGVSPKVTSSALGAAVSTIAWTLVGALAPDDAFTGAELASLTGATATVLGFAWGYLVREALREQS